MHLLYAFLAPTEKISKQQNLPVMTLDCLNGNHIKMKKRSCPVLCSSFPTTLWVYNQFLVPRNTVAARQPAFLGRKFNSNYLKYRQK